LRLAAIDIGSNAARLLISEVVQDANQTVRFNKLNLVRVPLRLGFDVFENGAISPERATMLIKSLQAYRHLIDVYQVTHFRAVATSAMRDATNAASIIKKAQKESGISIEILSGSDEASVIYENHIAEKMDEDHAYLYIDVGGGSTELTLFADKQLVFKESFNIGTIRLLKNMVTDSHWDAMKAMLKEKTKATKKVIAIGSGGNINKIFSLSKKKDGKPLHIELLKDYYKELNNFSVEERMHLYSLRADRADVIVPALQIYLNVMRWANAEEIYVPKIGLADGLIQHLYEELKADNKLA
jgi:exopolyphosphatase/guanosine-5'-triphosphate,3'-diphosphate pyrophosphatase